ALERKVGKRTLYREERYSGLVSRTVLKTSLYWKLYRLSLTNALKVVSRGFDLQNGRSCLMKSLPIVPRMDGALAGSKHVPMQAQESFPHDGT
ncbi:MAG: hypothetical protein DRR19_32745, partial [Candidatus Parabeggiatoa sp. nov. 1]